MLETISWTDYLISIVAVLLVYYLLVILIYYRSELMLFASGLLQTKTGQKGQMKKESGMKTADNMILSSVHELMNDLGFLFADAERRGFQKEELIMALQMKLKAYHNIAGSQYQDTINIYIGSESRACCKIELDTRELQMVW